MDDETGDILHQQRVHDLLWLKLSTRTLTPIDVPLHFCAPSSIHQQEMEQGDRSLDISRGHSLLPCLLQN